MKTFDIPYRAQRRRKKRPSPAQLRSRDALATAAHGWDDLTDEEWKAWEAAGKQQRTCSKGRTRRLNGRKYYLKINGTRAFLGLPRLRLPPSRSLLKPNPVGALSITCGPGGITLKLRVPSAPAPLTKVLGSPPQHRGRRFCADFRYLGLLPAPHGGASDITALYVNRFGNPPPGWRVFIRTQQQLDGQQDLPVQTDALVPGRWKRRPPPARAERKRGDISKIYRKYIVSIS